MKRTIKVLASIGLGVLFVPSVESVSAGESTYQVQRGDTLSQIAHKHNTSLNELIQLNNIKNKDVIHPGQTLYVKSSSNNNQQTDDTMSQIQRDGSFPIEQQYYTISSNFGPRTHPITGEQGSFHNGIDLAGRGINRSNIYSVLKGTVTHAGNTNNGYGHYVVIQHDGFSTLYAHMAEAPTVRKGQRVSSGDKIGIVGSTGSSTNPHLHFEINIQGRRVNPKPYLEAIRMQVTTSSSPNKQTLEKVHTVKSGDTIGKIAAQYNTTQQNVIQLNSLQNPNRIFVGQKLIINQKTEPNKPSIKPSTPAPNKTYQHTIKPGDSLWKIANQFNLSVKELKAINNLRSDLIFVGQTLTVSKNNTQTNQSTRKNTHIVQRADTLWKIASRNGLTVKQLKEINQLTSDLIIVGQTLYTV